MISGPGCFGWGHNEICCECASMRIASLWAGARGDCALLPTGMERCPRDRSSASQHPHHGSIPADKECGCAAPAISQFPVQRQTLPALHFSRTEVVLKGCYPSSTDERFRSYG